jgi:hypothetical protein
VAAATLTARGKPACLEWSWHPAPGESVSVLPVMTPALWIWARRKPGAVRVRYEVAARTRSGERLVLYSEPWPAAPPVAEIRAPLDALAGQEVALEFCTELIDGPPLGIEAGWAEPHVVRRRETVLPPGS